MTISREQALAALERADREMAERLRTGVTGVEAAELALKEAKEVRAGIISEAISAGWTQQRIADELGVSRQRVAQLIAADQSEVTP